MHFALTSIERRRTNHKNVQLKYRLFVLVLEIIFKNAAAQRDLC